MTPRAAQSSLSEADVAALFGGTYTAPTPVSSPEEAARPWTARYDRCDGCAVIQACLTSICGETDWAPFIPIGGPLRAWVTRYRRENHVRTVNLCGHCITDLNAVLPVTADGQLELFTS